MNRRLTCGRRIWRTTQPYPQSDYNEQTWNLNKKFQERRQTEIREGEWSCWKWLKKVVTCSFFSFVCLFVFLFLYYNVRKRLEMAESPHLSPPLNVEHRASCGGVPNPWTAATWHPSIGRGAICYVCYLYLSSSSFWLAFSLTDRPNQEDGRPRNPYRSVHFLVANDCDQISLTEW